MVFKIMKLGKFIKGMNVDRRIWVVTIFLFWTERRKQQKNLTSHNQEGRRKTKRVEGIKEQGQSTVSHVGAVASKMSAEDDHWLYRHAC